MQALKPAGVAMAVAGVLAITPAASAKEPVSGQVCGAAACKPLTEPTSMLQALRWESTFQIVRAPRVARYFRLTFSAPDPDGFRWRVLYVPSLRVMRVDDRAATPPEYGTPVRPYWRTTTRRQVRLLADLTRGLAPFRAPRRWTAAP